MPSHVIKQLYRFILCGIMNTTVNYCIFLLLFATYHIHYITAGAIGFLAGAVLGYILNRTWTFNSKLSIGSTSLYYLFVQMICLLIHLVMQHMVVIIFCIDYVYSQFFGIVVTTFFNFFLSRRYVFKGQQALISLGKL